MIVDAKSQLFGLSECLRIPIAAASMDAIEQYVGRISDSRRPYKGRVNAICVEPLDRLPNKHPDVKLWTEPDADEYEARLHPPKQVWVHVDYSNYREAYLGFGMPPIAANYFLDHIQNREAMRLRGYTHPYLRLCPVSRQVNTNAGGKHGGEGLEKDYLRSLVAKSSETREAVAKAMQTQMIYADPLDITKMLDISPGTEILNGVRDTLSLLYPT